MKFNVAYDDAGVTRFYLKSWVDKHTAEVWAKKFSDRYVGKPYPNGQGVYAYTNVRVVEK